MDANKLLNDSLKREARKAITEYLKDECHDLAREEASVIAKKWIKDNKETLEEMVNAEMDKRVKSMVKDSVRGICEAIRYY